jgi:hypothetical protein
MAHPARSLEEKRRGLMALILCRTSHEAEEQTGIPWSTLTTWKSRDPALYEQLREELEPQIAKRIAADAEMIAQRLAAKELEIIDAMTPEKIQALDGDKLAGTLRNVSTSKALQVDKLSSPLRERPSHVQQHGNINDLVSKMAKAMGFSEEPIDATVVEESDTANSNTDTLEPARDQANAPAT